MQPALRAACAAAVLAASLAGMGALHAQGQKPGDEGFSYGDLTEVTLKGRLISLRDEMARKYGARVAGGGPEKQWGLALPEGELYTFLDTEQYRRLAAANLGGQPAEVRARKFPRSMLLEVLSFRPLPAQEVRRRFYCLICDIHTEDWGPCACCGKEVQVVKEPKQ